MLQLVVPPELDTVSLALGLLLILYDSITMSPLAMMTRWSVVSDQWSPILNPPLVARNTLLISDDKSSTGHATRTGRCRCSSSSSPSLLSWLKDNWVKNQLKCLEKTTGGQFTANIATFAKLP